MVSSRGFERRDEMKDGKEIENFGEPSPVSHR